MPKDFKFRQSGIILPNQVTLATALNSTLKYNSHWMQFLIAEFQIHFVKLYTLKCPLKCKDAKCRNVWTRNKWDSLLYFNQHNFPLRSTRVSTKNVAKWFFEFQFQAFFLNFVVSIGSTVKANSHRAFNSALYKLDLAPFE